MKPEIKERVTKGLIWAMLVTGLGAGVCGAGISDHITDKTVFDSKYDCRSKEAVKERKKANVLMNVGLGLGAGAFLLMLIKKNQNTK